MNTQSSICADNVVIVIIRWWLGPDTGIQFQPISGSVDMYPMLPNVATMTRGGYKTANQPVQQGLNIITWKVPFAKEVATSYVVACNVIQYPSQELQVDGINILGPDQIAVDVIDNANCRGCGITGQLVCRARQAGAGTFTSPLVLTPTTTSLVADQQVIQYPGPVTFTSTTSPPPNGVVNFVADGSQSIGVETVDSTGTAQLSALGGLQPGVHLVKAIYEGSTLFQSSQSAAVTLQVQPPPQSAVTLTLGINPNPAGPGTGVTIAATITPAQATGLITFYDGTTKLAGVGLVGGGAQFTSTFTTGVHQISASYAGDTAYFGTTSAQYPLVVSSSGTLASSVALTVNPLAPSTNTLVNISAVVSPTAATGSLVFTDNGTSIGTKTISSGAASLPARLFSIGTHKIGCTYSGDSIYKPAFANPITLSVNSTGGGTCNFAPTTTLSAQTSNNTSACSSASYGYKSPAYCNQAFVGFTDTQAGVITGTQDPAPGNVSLQPVSQLLYSGNTTDIFAELQAWFCTTSTVPISGYNGGQTCGGHKSVGYNSNDVNTVKGQMQSMIDRGFKGVTVDWYNTAIDSGRDDQATQLIATNLEARCLAAYLTWAASPSSIDFYNIKRSTVSGAADHALTR